MSIGDRNFNNEEAMTKVDAILSTLEQGYGITRPEARSCLAAMAEAVERFQPDDPGASAAFSNTLFDSAEAGEEWAEKTLQAILSWGDHE